MKYKKRIRVSGMSNLRDLGGYETKEGIVAWKKLYRGDLPLCSEADWQKLQEEHNIRHIIDLRSTAEKTTQDYLPPKSINVTHFPLIKEIEHAKMREEGKAFFLKSMAEQYLNIVLSNPEGLVEILTTIIKGLQTGSVLYHCTAGKDRTGIVTFFLYHLLGVDASDILADYQVSSTYNLYGNNVGNTLLKELSQSETKWMHSQPENLGCLMEYFEEHDMEAFLLQHGMDKELLKALQSMCIQLS